MDSCSFQVVNKELSEISYLSVELKTLSTTLENIVFLMG